MAHLDFPASPTVGDKYPATGTPQYTWDGEKWAIPTGAPFSVPDAPSDGSLYGRLDAAWSKAVKLAGDTMTGLLTLSANPTAALHAVTKQYADAGDTAANANANSRVLKAGDTITGALQVNSGLSVYSSATINGYCWTTGGQPSFIASTNGTYFGFWNSTTSLCLGTFNSAGSATGAYIQLTTTAFTVAYDNCQKPSGGPWLSPSDERIKTVVGDYTSGLDVIAALNPVRFVFKGNDTTEPPKNSPSGIFSDDTREATAVPYPNSSHYALATEGAEVIGLVAQAAEAVMPEMVTEQNGYIDGVQVDDLRILDTGPLVFALINAVKELKTINDQLTARVAALEGAV